MHKPGAVSTVVRTAKSMLLNVTNSFVQHLIFPALLHFHFSFVLVSLYHHNNISDSFSVRFMTLNTVLISTESLSISV